MSDQPGVPTGALGELEAAIGEAFDACGWPAGERADAVAALVELASAPLLFPDVARVAPKLVESAWRAADPQVALVRAARLAGRSINPQSTLHLMDANATFRSLVTGLVGFSTHLAETLSRSPEYLDDLVADAHLEEEKSLDATREELARALSPFDGADARRRALARYRRREMLRLGVREFARRAEPEVIWRELSSLAEACCEAALAEVAAPLLGSWGCPETDADGPPPSPDYPLRNIGFAVVAMGKLGGGDLNYSSDIDLLFTYDREGETRGGKRRVTNHEFYVRLASEFMTYLSGLTADGMLYRIDARLRPDGDSGPLARSIPAYSSYFADHAQPWECVAYWKARSVAGDPRTGAVFEEMAGQFAFGADPGSLIGEVARLKRRIDADRLDEAGRRNDIKRGPGGIREIEFIVGVELLSTARGRSDARPRRTIEALEVLRRKGRIARDDADFLRDAYTFLRRLEHVLQMEGDQQTHALPEDHGARAVLARKCGFDGAGAFEDRLADVRGRVRGLFERWFDPGGDARPTSLVEKLEREPEPDEAALDQLRPYGLDSRSGYMALRELAVGTSEVAIRKTGRRLFREIAPTLLGHLDLAPDPESAVRNINNLLIAYRDISGLYELLAAHPPVVRLLVRLLGSSQLVSRTLAARPGWFDDLLGGDGLDGGRDMGAAYGESDAAGVTGPLEEWCDELRVFKSREALFSAARELLGTVPSARAAAMDTDLAEVCLRELGGRIAAERGFHAPWAVLALGSFGACETHLFSDLDVGFLYAGENGDGDAVEAANRFAGELLSTISAVTPRGKIWKTDARLRPDGGGSPLAVAEGRAASYYAGEAQVWEFQSATRARFVAGDADLGARAVEAIRSAWRGRAGSVELAREVATMRRRLDDSVKLPRWAAADLKRGAGGLADVEFALQYLLLRESAADAGFPWFADAAGAAGALRDAGVLDADDAAWMLEHERTLRTVQRAVRLLGENARSFLPGAQPRREAVCRALADQVDDPGALLDGLPAAMRRMRGLMDRILGA